MNYVLWVMTATMTMGNDNSIIRYHVDESKPYCIILYKSLSILIIIILIIIAVFEIEK